VLLASKDKRVAELAERIESAMSWPNKPGDKTPPLTPLTAPQQARFETGRVLFTQICAQCHQPSGLGQEGLAPPLVDSEWVLGSSQRVVRIVLNGVHGPIQVGRKTVDLEMPGLGTLDDEQIASVLTYIRREWGHEGSPIDPQAVTAIRKETTVRGELQWTMQELEAIK
jgi:mono/diheme cytochrome c family protein